MISLASGRLAGREQAESLADVLIEPVSLVFAGYVGSFSIVEYVGDDADIQVQPDGDLVHVRARSDLGLMQLWLDPDAGFLPRRLHLVKQGTDRTFGDRTVQDLEIRGRSERWVSGSVDRLEWSADDIDLQRSGEGFYMRSVELDKRMFMTSGAVQTTRSAVTIDEITFSPEFDDDDFRPLLKIPVGTGVSIMGASHLPYEWDGEKVVPRSRQRQAEVAVEAARKRGGSVSGGLRLPWLIGINTALIAAIAAVLWYQRRAA